MAKLLGNLYLTLGVGLLLAIVMSAVFHPEVASFALIIRWVHVFFGIVWIGLLYYFNLVQIPTMPKIPAELKGGVSKFIAPEALFYFRWGAAFTVLAGLLLAWAMGYLREAFEMRQSYRLIGTGMWLGLIMAFNVWFIIWPNQKRALGLVEADDASKARSAKTAMMTSRINTILSIPLLYAMTTFQSAAA